MRMIVFFDLPVKEKTAQKAAAKFRNFLIKDGYLMIQYSVYSRVCNGYDAVKMHEKGSDSICRLMVQCAY